MATAAERDELIDCYLELESIMWRMEDMVKSGSRAKNQYAHWSEVYELWQEFEALFDAYFVKQLKD